MVLREKGRSAEIIQLPKVEDPRGNLTFIQGMKEIPFEVKRAYWIYDVPGGRHRGSHAFKSAEEFIVAMSGAFEVVVENDLESETFLLNRSYFGLYVPNMNWRSIVNFSSNSMALILSSTPYVVDDYIRDREEFNELILG